MWVARQHYERYEVKIRLNGKFASNDYCALVAALFEWGWCTVAGAIAMCCQNKAAVCLLDSNIADAERWIARAKAIRGVE